MKVAIPVWADRVSPLFDEARHILVAGLREDHVPEIHHLEFAGDRVKSLQHLGVDVLICGAISADIRSRLVCGGMELHAWIRGDADEVLAAYIAGSLDAGHFKMPGAPIHQTGTRGQRWGTCAL
jgi:predicted Fe-Mo cluster-binding NifX family protein